MPLLNKRHLLPIVRSCLLALAAILGLFPLSAAGQDTLPILPGLYEPSGIACTSAGDLLIVEDEESDPLHLFQIDKPHAPGTITLSHQVSYALDTPASDLEGIAAGKEDSVFLITSHSRNSRGQERPKRQRLIQLTMTGRKIVRQQYFNELQTHLTGYLGDNASLSLDELAALNIEGLAFNTRSGHLLIGLRAPLQDGKSMLLELENPYEIFAGDTPPQFAATPILLDLAGGGIRAMTFDMDAGGYLLANEIAQDNGTLQPQIWHWSGRPADRPVKLALPLPRDLHNIEGITLITSNGQRFVVLVCDDGQKKMRRNAHYLVVPFNH